MFRLILHELVATTSGALAALFLDWEGETVDLVCEHDLPDDDLRIMGAYQGVLFSQLRQLCSHLSAGVPHRFKVEFDTKSVLSLDVKDGYYVVLLLGVHGNEGLAWRGLERCKERLIGEM